MYSWGLAVAAYVAGVPLVASATASRRRPNCGPRLKSTRVAQAHLISASHKAFERINLRHPVPTPASRSDVWRTPEARGRLLCPAR